MTSVVWPNKVSFSLKYSLFGFFIFYVVVYVVLTKAKTHTKLR